MPKPLDGLLVVDLSQNVAGPFCSQILGDLGADVVKIERPGRGDDSREWAPPFWGDESAAFLSMNRSKRSLALDVKSEQGQVMLRRLVAKADVFMHSLAAGGAERIGAGPEALTALNAKLIYCAITSFGEQGPYSRLPGYDALMQAWSGLMSVTGHAGQGPVRVGASVVDLGTGMWAALGVLAALRDREQSGRGTTVTAALFETALNWVSYPIAGYLATGKVPGPQGSGMSSISPYQAFPCRDCEVMIAAANDTQFQSLCRALGLEQCARDEKFRDNPRRVEHRVELAGLVAEATIKLTSDELLARLQKAHVPCAPIHTIDKVVSNPQTEASGLVRAIEHPTVQHFRSVGLPLRWGGQRAEPSRAPPLLGQHSRQIAESLGYSKTEIDSFVASGVLGSP